MAEKNKGFFGRLVDAAQDVTTTVAKTLKGAKDKAEDVVMDAFDSADKAINGGENSEVGKTIKDLIDKGAEMINESSKVINETFDEIMEDPKEVVGNFMNSTAEFAQQTASDLGNGFKDLAQGYYQLIMNPSETISNIVDGGKEVAKEIDEFISGEKEQAGKAAKKIEGTAKIAADTISKTAGNISKAVNEAKQDVLGDDRTYIDKDGNFTEEFFNDLEDTFGKEARDTVENAQKQGLLTAVH